MMKKGAECMKSDFQINVPQVVTVHWDGKLLPGLGVRSSRKEHLLILILFGDKEQILAVPKLVRPTGKDQFKAVSNALYHKNLTDKLQIMHCDTTASNTSCLNGASVLFEQKPEKRTGTLSLLSPYLRNQNCV